MVRNLDHRVEASCPIRDENIKNELKDILNIQLKDNVKARWLDNDLNNEYVRTDNQITVRSQIETYKYLHQKTLTPVEVSSY
jgi:polyphosphate kinase